MIDKKTGKEVKKSKKTKNEYVREMAKVAIIDNKIKCKWILADVWFSSNDNMEYIKFDLKCDFVMPIKTNRLVGKTKEEKRKGRFQQVETLDISENYPFQYYWSNRFSKTKTGAVEYYI